MNIFFSEYRNGDSNTQSKKPTVCNWQIKDHSVSSRNQYTPQVIHTTVLHSSIEQMIPTVSGACYAISSMVNISNINSLKSIYHA